MVVAIFCKLKQHRKSDESCSPLDGDWSTEYSATYTSMINHDLAEIYSVQIHFTITITKVLKLL